MIRDKMMNDIYNFFDNLKDGASINQFKSFFRRNSIL